MNSTLQFQYPIWTIGLCLLLGLLFAFLLYYRDHSLSELTDKQRRWIWPLGLMRFLAASSIAMLLLAPLIKTQFTDVQKPYIIVANDNSTSVAASLTEEEQANLKTRLNNLKEELGEDYEVETYDFGDQLNDELTYSYHEKVTNISKVMDEIYNRYNHQNVGAVIMATDGIYNEGSNPIYQPLRLNAPIYTVALGDTTAKKDLKIEKILHNRIAYLGDKFTIRADVSAFNAKGTGTVLNVYKGAGRKNKVFSKSLGIKTANYFHSEDVVLDADKSGVIQYTISVSKIEGEHTLENNYKTIYVDVLDGRQKILVLANSPHPDVSSLRKSIEQNKNYEVETKWVRDFNGNPADYDLIVMHGLPSVKHAVVTLLDQIKAKNIPVWFVVSSQTSISSLNKAQDALKINGSSNSFNEVKPNMQSGFALFKLDAQLVNAVNELPPVRSRYGEYAPNPTSQSLMMQKIGNVETNYPLLVYGQSQQQKTAVLCAEGFWRWSLFDHMKDERGEVVNDIVSKTVQYLAVKEDKRKFRVNQAKKVFNENENISFDAELYNDSYELINEPDASLTIRDGEGKDYPFTFNKTTNAYDLDAGILPVGDYSYFARTVYTGKELTASGAFNVKEVQLESLNSTADHSMLFQLSEKHGGEMMGLADIGGISDKIKGREDIKPVLYSSYKTQSVINKKWLFFLILLMLGLEWFVRKYLGAY